jgi:hypothetical protein
MLSLLDGSLCQTCFLDACWERDVHTLPLSARATQSIQPYIDEMEQWKNNITALLHPDVLVNEQVDLF